jgi:iron complex outermembrane recepter protein
MPFCLRQRHEIGGQAKWGILARHLPQLPRSKFFQKSEKRACQLLESPLMATPNLTKPMEKLMIRNVLNKLGFTRSALVVGVGIPFVMAVTAYAQAPATAPAAAEAERVVVTGSNIPTAEEVTASPLDTLTTADISRAGTSEVLNVLQKRNPDFIGAGNIGTTNANIASGATEGGAVIQIRGLPTLVLLNGRRITDSAAIAVGGAQFSDVNLFPTALIGRIEVLKDGASAIYGSEAVGGVVNIFMKQDFEGVEAGYRYGFTIDGGVAERRAYLIAGTGNATTHVTAGVQYYEIDPLFQRERGYSTPPISFAAGVTTTYAGSARDADGRFLLNPGLNSPFDLGILPGSIPATPDLSAQFGSPLLAGAYSPATQTEVQRFDLSTQPTNTQGAQRTNVYGAFTHQFFGKQLEMFGDVLYSHNVAENFLNGQPLSTATDVIILGSTKVDPATGTLVPEDRGPPAPFNPFQLSLEPNSFPVLIGNRFQTNPRIFRDTANFYRVLGGLRSQITDDWMVEGAAYYSNYGISFVNSNLVKADQLNNMIAGTALDNDGLPIPALDFFARNVIGTGPGQVSLAQFNTIFDENIRALDSYQRAFDLKVVGFPIKLPAGPIGIVVGASIGVDGFKVKDSPEIFIATVPIQEIQVGRTIHSYFAELAIPIVGSEMAVPFVYNFEVSLAGRYAIYEGIDEHSKVPKITLRYQPIKDLTLRASYSNSFVAPTLYQLFGPTVQGFSDTIVFNGVVNDQAQVRSGANPNLFPSTAESYGAGLVYSPSFVPGLTITADYFRTLQQDIVSAFGGQTILSDVNNLGAASQFAAQVAFNNFPGFPGAIPITSNAPGQLEGRLISVYYFDPNINLGAARVEGFDLTANYNMDLRTLGQLELGINAVVFTKNDLKRAPILDYYNISGLLGPEFSGSVAGANPDYKLTFLLEHRWQGFILSLSAYYIPEMLNAVGHDPEVEDQSTFETIEDYISVDGRLSYEFKRQPRPVAAVESYSKDGKGVVGGKNVAGASVEAGGEVMSPFDRVLDGLRLTVGCNNIFDEEPRFVRGANSATSLSTYDPYQRFLYFEVVKKF